MRLRDWFSRRSTDVGSQLPDKWESLRSFTVLIPFTEHTINLIDASLAEALKLREHLTRAYHSKYFANEAYQGITALTATGETIPPDLHDYWDLMNREAEIAVSEKIHIILLHDDANRRLSESEAAGISAGANRHSNCDVLDFGGDPLVHDPRKGVVRYLRGRKAFLLPPGTRLSDKKAATVLVDHVNR
jgi:hypothetical protein